MCARIGWIGGLVSILVAAAVPAAAASSEAEAVAREYLEVSGALAQENLEAMREYLVAASTEPQEVVDIILEETSPEKLADVLAPICARHLSVDDMRAAIRFYRSPAGRKLAAAQPVLLAESAQAVSEWLEEVEPRIRERLEALDIADSPLVNKRKQKETVAALRNTGTAWMSWLTDVVSSSGAGPDIPRLGEWTVRKEGSPGQGSYSEVAYDSVVGLLVPVYIAQVPATDGWGHPLEFALNEDVLASSVMCIRSAGADGIFEGDTYTIGPFGLDDYGQDIVWCDGYFVRWPGS